MLEARAAPQNLLEHSDVTFCPDADEPDAATLGSVPAYLKYLMVIGALPSPTSTPAEVPHPQVCYAFLDSHHGPVKRAKSYEQRGRAMAHSSAEVDGWATEGQSPQGF